MTVVTQILVRCWHFQCPECGMGDEEIGQFADHDEIYCEVCLAESDRHVRLHRWPADAGAVAENDQTALTRSAA